MIPAISIKIRFLISNLNLLNKSNDIHGDLQTGSKPEILVGCLFEEHPNQKSLRKAGWVAELQEGSSIIHVPYDLKGLQTGALFSIPSGLDNAEPRLFRVISMQNIMVYPASIACEIAVEYATSDEASLTQDFSSNNFTVLVDHEEDD